MFSLVTLTFLLIQVSTFPALNHNREIVEKRNSSSKMTSTINSSKPTLPSLLKSNRDEVVSALGPIYEHSTWVAEALYDEHLVDTKMKNGITTVHNLFVIMKNIVDSSTHDQKLTLLREHPDLCERVSVLKNLTESSQEEQCRAGLQYMTEDERDVFTSTNNKYKEKFGFPFILAVRNASKYTVLSAIRARVLNSKETEFAAAIGQVHKIAWMRLLGKISIEEPKGFLTCHVLDTATGSPGENGHR